MASGDLCQQPDDHWSDTCLRRIYAKPLALWPAPRIEGGGPWQEMAPASHPDLSDSVPYGLLRLGIELFYDPALSASGKISCASCHRPNAAFADNQTISPGHAGRLGRRNAPALVSVASATSLFWDGRAPDLEHQALGPIADSKEMAMPLAELAARLAARPGYPQRFQTAFGDPTVTLARIQSALAAYERTLQPARTRFDRLLEGDVDAFDTRELLGLHLFRGKAGCMTCHSGAALNDNRFHNLGLTYFGRSKYEDLGRYGVSGDPADVGKFRTPTLRNIGRSGPWMHNGLFVSLRGIVNMYNAGGFRPQPANMTQAADPRFPITSDLLKPLHLSEEEVQALEAFLNIL